MIPGFFAAGAMGQGSGPPPGGFPVALTPTMGVSPGGGVSHTINLPSSSVGDLWIIYMGSGGNTSTINPSVTFTSLLERLSAAAAFRIMYRVVDGSEPSSMTVTTGGAVRIAYICHRIQAGTYSGTPQASTASNGTGAAPKSNAITPAWGAGDNLFLSMFNGQQPGAGVLTYPFAGGNYNIGSGGGTNADVEVASCWLQSTSATVTPTAYSRSAAAGTWRAGTVAIRPF